MIVGIDSMVLVYAGLVPKKRAKPSRQPTPDEQQNLQKLSKGATFLLDEFADNNATVVLPTVAVSELLVPVPASRHGAVIAKLASRFHCHPFDQRAAAIAAELWARHRNLVADQQYGSRQILKADTMIVATAKAFGASAFYTHDDKCRRLADLVMQGRGLPTHKYDLFADLD